MDYDPEPPHYCHQCTGWRKLHAEAKAQRDEARAQVSTLQAENDALREALADMCNRLASTRPEWAANIAREHGLLVADGHYVAPPTQKGGTDAE